MRVFCAAAALLLGGLTLCASVFETGRNGTIKVDNTAFVQLLHYGENWVPNRQGDGSFNTQFTERNGVRSWSGVWKLRQSPVHPQFRTELRTPDSGTLQLSLSLDSPEGVPTKAAALEIDLPVLNGAGTELLLDGKPVPLPVKFRGGTIAQQKNVRRIELPLASGRLLAEPETPVAVQVLDVRAYKQDKFTLRIALEPQAARLTHAALSLRLTFHPYSISPLPLESAANMGFADETADDRKGGWTDQGPTNDLRALPSGRLTAGPVAFRIADPAASGSKSCIVLGGGGRRYFPKSAEIPAGGRPLRTLFLLHAIAWPPQGEEEVGTLRAFHSDGTETAVPVIARRDVDNWWAPSPAKSAVIGYSGYSAESPVGLYLAGFPLPGRPVEKIRFESNGKSVWMIAAVSASPDTVRLPAPAGFTLYRNADWKPFRTEREIEPGSALDFSFLLDAPAGKYGAVRTTPDGHFEFERRPGQPVRFYGANLVLTANFMAHDAADLLAERFARIGYNAVRLHHFDRDLMNRKAPDSLTMDPKAQEQFDYLIHAMKRRGIYFTLDLFTHRYPAAGEYREIPDMELGDYKLGCIFSPEAMANLKEFTRRLLTRRNPHTGLTLAEDPALAGLSLVNENSFMFLYRKGAPKIQKLAEAQFAAWTKARSLAVTPQNRETLFHRFLIDAYRRSCNELTAFVRGLGVRAPLTDQNYIAAPEMTLQRRDYDYVDNHLYWDHPQFLGPAWSLPAKFNNCSVLNVRLLVPKAIAPSRVFGKPFTVTEFDFCYPNSFRSEGAPIFGAYAAMQDWGAVYRFAYSHNAKYMLTGDTTITTFDTVNDPVRLLGERLGIAFFTRRDVAPSQVSYPVAVPENPWDYPWRGEYPQAACELMFFGKVGSVGYGNGGFNPALPADSRLVYSLDRELNSRDTALPVFNAPDFSRLVEGMQERHLLSPGQADLKRQRFQSSTGELTADFSRKTFTAVTSRSEALVVPEGETVKGTFLSAECRKNFATVGVIALDGKPLARSGRLLLLHLADVKAETIAFTAPDCKVMTSGGDGQLLARRAIAGIRLNATGSGWKLYRLALTGKRLGTVEFQQDENGIAFTADTFHNSDVVFAYELVR